MVHQTFTHHYIRHSQAGVDATCHTGTDNAVRSKTAYQLRSSYRRIHLADATLRKYHTITAKQSFYIMQIAVTRHFLILQAFHQLAVFAVHCTDYPYCHIYNNLSLHITIKAL